MVFKHKLFFSSKKSGSSSPNSSSNSPQSVGSTSPIGSDKQIPKSSSEDEPRSPDPIHGGGKYGLKKKDSLSKGKEVPVSGSEAKKPISVTKPPYDVKEGPASEAPILTSFLNLNRIKTRSGPLPQGNDKPISVPPCWDSISGNGNAKKEGGSSKREVEANLDRISPDNGQLRSSSSPTLAASGTDQFKVAPSQFDPVGSSEFSTQENSYELDNPKELKSPRYQALLRMTSAPRKRFPGDIKSFSHELNSKGVRPFPLWRPRKSNNVEEIVDLIRTKFDKAKEEVNLDLRVFALDLVDMLNTRPELRVAIEDLLVLAKKCNEYNSGEFWVHCEGIVQGLDDKRQELPPGVLKKLHTRMLFILTRCTRLLQFHKESWGAEEDVVQLRQSRVLHSVDKGVPTRDVRDGRDLTADKALKVPSTKKAYSQEHHGMNWKESFIRPAPLSSPYDDAESPASIDRMSSWKRLPSPASKSAKEAALTKEQNDRNFEHPKVVKNRVATSDDIAVANPPYCPPAKLSHEQMYKHQNNPWGHWREQSYISKESSIICRICEEEVPTTQVEDHSKICALADKYDQKGANIDERLVAVAVTLDKITENFIQKDSLATVGSPDDMKKSNASLTAESDILSPMLSDWSRRGSLDMLDSISTSRPDPTDFLLGGKCTFRDQDDIPQMSGLAAIARCAANTIPDFDRYIELLLSCLEELRFIIDRRKFDALTVETFGTRIEKLIQEKYLQVCEILDDKKISLSSTVIDEHATLEDDVVRSLPVHLWDRTSIEDFEILKDIGRGAFGSVALAKKRTTGDLFAIKILKKADMILKNAVESILAERDILINTRNPFVVRFFYSFTCSENLYLVMEYLNGGDLYSLLTTVGCLDETNARVYIAEVVLALEYLHSQGVVHRDLKPDNLLIAHDGHVKLADFGLSKVGLIHNTNDLSGPLLSGTSLLAEDKPELPASEHQPKRRDKRSAVGTPDYLAPEILLGTRHGATADWWSVGIILFELIVGVPPFNASHPQQIFDNILNRDIPWPLIPEEMSHEACDLIDRLLTEDPHQRLGAKGAAEVKQHIFFKDINWHTLADQKAAFVPETESDLDTSYFKSRYPLNHSGKQCSPIKENEDSSDSSISGFSSNHNEGVKEHSKPTELETNVSKNSPFDNFSFKNLPELAYINIDMISKGHKDETHRT